MVNLDGYLHPYAITLSTCQNARILCAGASLGSTFAPTPRVLVGLGSLLSLPGSMRFPVPMRIKSLVSQRRVLLQIRAEVWDVLCLLTVDGGRDTVPIDVRYQGQANTRAALGHQDLVKMVHCILK